MRHWSVNELAARAGLSVDMVYRIEAGQASSLDSCARIAAALNRRAELHLVDPRRRDAKPNLSADVVHSAMGEFEAAHLRARGLKVGIDEPYQHYQFAGRADVIAWDVDTRALLHIENRTRFPDLQEMAGSFNAKRAYLGAAIAARAGVTTWRNETHVIAALWSAEVLHAIRLRTNSFRAICPDDPSSFEHWWEGRRPVHGTSATMVLIDPVAVGRRREWIDLEAALTARPRYRGYADVAASLS